MLVSKKLQKLLFLSSLLFLARLVLSFFPSFLIDMNTWLGWAARLREVGPAGFYSDATWTQYTPGFLYWLWLIGKLGWLNELAIKVPVILGDIGTSIFIWKMVEKKGEKWAYLLSILYVLSPVAIFTGSVWGQIDGIFTFFLLGSAYFLIWKKKLSLSAVLWAIAFLIKPQAAAFLIPTLFLMFIRKSSIRDYLRYIVPALIVIFVASIPFFPNDPLLGLANLIMKMTGFYNFTSVFAFNFWAIPGMWIADNLAFAGISYYVWGFILYLIALGLVFYRYRKAALKPDGAFMIFALSILVSFLFPTRVHERYLFPIFAFLLTASGISKSKFYLLIYVLLNFLNIINLYHPYAYYSDNYLKNESLLSFTGGIAPLVGISTIAIFFLLLNYVEPKKIEEKINLIYNKLKMNINFKAFMSENKGNKEISKLETFPKINLKPGNIKLILLSILLFSLVARIYALNSPAKEYFDEVYHAFTARVMLHGDPKAWEWWNTPPEGFAYEWTHPPMAKLGMVLGMFVLGENPVGWRLPGAILGVVSVYLVYLIAKEIFKDEAIGLMAAGIMALDGLLLVISRIGMNDIYMLTFALASLYLFLKDKNAASAFFLGLSLASKWSALWLIPIILVAHFVFKNLPAGRQGRLNWSYLWFFILPPLVYLGSYLPFFMEGHTFKQFFNFEVFKCIGKPICNYEFGLQQQMWWYHTNLKATHAYTSPWWSWPLNLRPVYLYTSDAVSGFVSRIYLIGNPMVFWMGLVSIFSLILLSLKVLVKKRWEGAKKILFVVFSYLIFFVPWAVSPRIMFLYHYLPSIPFMAIAIAYILRKNSRMILPFFIFSLIFFVYFFPHWTGLKVPEWLDLSYYWFNSWR
jgi:predicted membrane-bound dolichyl-phosphate-mannose-protein mannosyltransferase